MNFFADDGLWNRAERAQASALDDLGVVHDPARGEAAFCGPRIDVQVLPAWHEGARPG